LLSLLGTLAQASEAYLWSMTGTTLELTQRSAAQRI